MRFDQIQNLRCIGQIEHERSDVLNENLKPSLILPLGFLFRSGQEGFKTVNGPASYGGGTVSEQPDRREVPSKWRKSGFEGRV